MSVQIVFCESVTVCESIPHSGTFSVGKFLLFRIALYSEKFSLQATYYNYTYMCIGAQTAKLLCTHSSL